MSPIQPKTIPAQSHDITSESISKSALKVLDGLRDAGYQAYLVGGGVRDQLMGIQPKDFDIATDAHPEEVKQLFRNARLIGRRFRLVHVVFGREVIEVATFRGRPATPGQQDQTHHQSEHGMLLRDNIYGTMEEDALRRDFTANALYYCVDSGQIIDYADGVNDIDNRILRLIGDPETRYREDPVRMLRAARFAAKLDFTIEPRTEQAIFECAHLLHNIPPARLFDEVVKLLLSGQGRRTFELLQHYGLFACLFPAVDKLLKQQGPASDQALKLIQAGLDNSDARIRQNKPVTPAFLYATILWPDVNACWQHIMTHKKVPEFPALQQAINKALSRQLKHISIPKRFSLMMKEIWELQIRLKRNQKRRPHEVAGHPRFRAAYDFLLLRERSGEEHDQLGAWWTSYQEKNPGISSHDGKHGRERKHSHERKQNGPTNRRRRRHARSTPKS